MPDDRTNPTADEIREAWERYRDINFIRAGASTVWIWAAAHEFDFAVAGLHLLGVPGAHVDIGPGAFALMAFDAHHIVPLARMTALSLEHLQPRATFSLQERQAELRELQGIAEAGLANLVHARFPVSPPATGDHGQQIH